MAHENSHTCQGVKQIRLLFYQNIAVETFEGGVFFDDLTTKNLVAGQNATAIGPLVSSRPINESHHFYFLSVVACIRQKCRISSPLKLKQTGRLAAVQRTKRIVCSRPSAAPFFPFPPLLLMSAPNNSPLPTVKLCLSHCNRSIRGYEPSPLEVAVHRPTATSPQTIAPTFPFQIFWFLVAHRHFISSHSK